MDSGTLTITMGDTTFEYDTTDKTYDQLLTEMSYNSKLETALEQVGDDEYRLVIKSVETGLDNAISISESGDLNLGYSDEENNHVVKAQNMEATIDGIEYNLSSNKVTMENGLIISAVEKGDSVISIERDTSYVVEQINEMATVYNELVELVDSYTSGDEETSAIISDSGTLTSIVSSIKSMFYESYGLSDEENIFSYGISFNEYGNMEIDSSTLSEAVNNNFNDLESYLPAMLKKRV